MTFAAETSVGSFSVEKSHPPMLSKQLRSWESTPELSSASAYKNGIDSERWKTVLTQFATRLIEETIEPIPEFDAIITERFWDLA